MIKNYQIKHLAISNPEIFRNESIFFNSTDKSDKIEAIQYAISPETCRTMHIIMGRKANPLMCRKAV